MTQLWQGQAGACSVLQTWPPGQAEILGGGRGGSSFNLFS